MDLRELQAAALEEQLASLIEKTERYCTVLQTFREPPRVDSASTG